MICSSGGVLQQDPAAARYNLSKVKFTSLMQRAMIMMRRI